MPTQELRLHMGVSTHAPVKARPNGHADLDAIGQVSTHAPVKARLQTMDGALTAVDVSTHAPVKARPDELRGIRDHYRQFQPTRL